MPGFQSVERKDYHECQAGLMFDRRYPACRIDLQVFLIRRLPGRRHDCPVAIVAELADAHGSGPCTGNGVGVRVPSMAPRVQLIGGQRPALRNNPQTKA